MEDRLNHDSIGKVLSINKLLSHIKKEIEHEE